MAELYAHLREMESAIPYFYCDDHQLVTIAIGYLVDQTGATDAVGQGLARALARRGDVAFARNGAGVDADAVVADWQRVKAHGRANPRDNAARFGAVAQLRISDLSMRNLVNTTIASYANQL
jgi:NAD(P)-dependent dehydrogenase (short-subunit alcohol dehydrogenase family)